MYREVFLDVLDAIAPSMIGVTILVSIVMMQGGQLPEAYHVLAGVSSVVLIGYGLNYADLKGEKIVDKYESDEYED